jgi:hypothetical protein
MKKHLIPVDEEVAWAIHSHSTKCTLDIMSSGSVDFHDEERHAQCSGCGSDGFQLARCAGTSRIEEEGDTRYRRGDLLEELEPFGDQFTMNVRQPRDVSARPGQAGDQTGANWVGVRHDDDG